MFKRILFFSFLISLFNSCNKDDNGTGVNMQDLKISSFEIIDNTKNGIYTQTKISPASVEGFKISNHGVIWTKDGSFSDTLNLGNLKKNSFDANFATNLIIGETYSVYPYLLSEYGYVYGDTLSFVSNVEVDILINEISPKKGFIQDTITIRGENFCTSSLSYYSSNSFLLDETYHNVIFESDTLIQAVINSSIKKSELKPSLNSCGILIDIDETFLIDEPVLDSITNKNLYVGDELIIYGKNIHHNISKVWLEGIELELERSDSITFIKAIIPENLPEGKLDFKLQVLDRIIEKTDYYQSTTPIIEEINPSETGYLETVKIVGRFFEQPNSSVEAFINGAEQTVLSISDEEIEVLLDGKVNNDIALITVKTAGFSTSKNIKLLPPQILGLDKELYHFDDDMKIDTKFYIGDDHRVSIGGRENNFSSTMIKFDKSTGSIDVSLEEWFGSSSNGGSLFMKEPGILECKIKTDMGESTMDFSMYPPVINKIDKDEYYHQENILIEGTDFAYSSFCKIYVDNVLVNTKSARITSAEIGVPNNLYPGDHSLKIVTAGQESNEVSFTIKGIEANNLTPKIASRKTVFRIEGSNLDNRSYWITANGYECKILTRSDNIVEFEIKQDRVFEPSVNIKLKYGPEVFDLGNVTIIEPHEIIEEYSIHPYYHDGSYSFEYDNKLHFINRHGIFQFDENTYTWYKTESNIPVDSFHNSRITLPVVNNQLFLPYGNILHIYNFDTKSWSIRELNIEGSILRAAIHNNILVATETNGWMSNRQIRYNLDDDTSEIIESPFSSIGNYTSLHYSNGKMYYDRLDDDIYVYDIDNNSWENIGFPMEHRKYFYNNNLYVYDGVLYFSGGRSNSDAERGLYGYDLQTKQWAKKTPSLNIFELHSVFGSGSNLYFLLGKGIYYHTNSYLGKYDIDKDNF